MKTPEPPRVGKEGGEDMSVNNKCGRCNGKGKLYSLNDCYNWDCPRCNGTGIDPLWAELETIKAALKDPHAVHTNMMRGTVATLSESQFRHLLGLPRVDEQAAELTRIKQAMGAIHKEAVYRFSKGHAMAPDWARVQCERAIPELKQETK